MADQPKRDANGGRRPSRGSPGPDLMSDFQRWLLRSSARNVRREIGDQVRGTFGVRTGSRDVWDAATTEIPSEVGEAPECQWCPICRAARRLRESRPGVGGQLTAVGDAVAAAVQDALGALDAVLTRGGPAGAGDQAEPGAGDRAEPGAGERAEAGAGDQAEAGAGERAEAGAGERAEAGAGDQAEPGAGDQAEPGAGGRAPGGPAATPHPGQAAGPGGWVAARDEWAARHGARTAPRGHGAAPDDPG